MSRLSPLLAVLLLLLPTTGVSASVAAELQQLAEARRLADEPYWHALLHYSAIGSSKAVKSEIISPEFFLAADGATDPHAELAATLTALVAEPDENPDEHAQCRFIARYRWLHNRLPWPDTAPVANCPAFREWSLGGNIDSISLVFATGYLGNPASFYGHILLKFNSNSRIATTDLLDQSINFGAIVPDGENPLVYVVRGLFGGYDAAFSHNKFYRFNHIYAENELRDLWEYRLRLDPEQLQRLIDHSWELLGKHYVYFFTRENCAFRMAELLELAVEQPLINHDLPWAIPGSVFDYLLISDADTVPLVESVSRIPSRQNRLYGKFAHLDNKQQRVAGKLVNEDVDLALPDYATLSAEEKVGIVDTLLDYYEFRLIEARDDETFSRARHRLLIERAALAPLSPPENSLLTPADPPHRGPRPGMVRTSLVHNTDLGSGIELRLRPVYYDLLSLQPGRLPDSALTMFDLRVAYLNEHVQVRALDLARVDNLNVSRTGLPGDGGWAWRFKTGWRMQHLACDDCLEFHIGGGYGRGLTLGANTTAYLMADLDAQTAYRGFGTLNATASLGLLTAPSSSWSSHLEFGRRYHLNGTHDPINVLSWQNRFGNARSHDIRVGYEENGGHELTLSLSLYW